MQSVLCYSWFCKLLIESKRIFEYEDIKSETPKLKSKNINPYLVGHKEILIDKRTNPLCNVPKTTTKGSSCQLTEVLLLDEMIV
jgi:hypothetical protein